MGLDSSIALVTGAASGIGRASATALCAEGARVGLIDQDAEAGAAVADALGRDAVFVTADVTDESQVRAAVHTVVEQFGGLDIVVGCAGVAGPFGRSIDDVSVDDWNAVFAVNVTGQFLVVRQAVQHLRASPNAAVVLVASDSSFVAAPGMVPYNASKGAVLQLMRALSVDLERDGIRVNCVCPSIVDTPMSRADLAVDHGSALDDATFPVQEPENVAHHVVYLSSSVSRPINGHALVSDFGYLARSSFPA